MLEGVPLGRQLDSALGIETAAGAFTPLIPRGTDLPAHFSDTCATAARQQRSVRIHILALDGDGSSEGSPAPEPRSLVNIQLQDVKPTEGGQARIWLMVDVDLRGNLDVVVRDASSGHEERRSCSRVLHTVDDA